MNPVYISSYSISPSRLEVTVVHNLCGSREWVRYKDSRGGVGGVRGIWCWHNQGVAHPTLEDTLNELVRSHSDLVRRHVLEDYGIGTDETV